MSAVIQLEPRDGDRGGMDEVLQRLGRVESSTAEIQVEVSRIAAATPHLATKDEVGRIAAAIPHLATKDEVGRIAAAIPHLATKDEVSRVAAAIPRLATKDEVSRIAAMIPHLATKADLNATVTRINAMEVRIIKWMIATALTSVSVTGGLAFTIAKLVH